MENAMRKLILLALLMLGACHSTANAQPMNRVAIGYQQITTLSSAIGLTPPSGASEAFILCTGQTVMWRDDGTNPTASVGIPLPVNTAFPYVGSLARIKFIETAASATCNVSYYQ
jgi:hypothetical protein